MRSKIGAGIAGGLTAGVVFGAMMTMMTAPTPDGGEMPMMAMVAQVGRCESLLVGWIYHLFNSAVIGAICGWALGGAATGYGKGLLWGLLYGVLWWVLGAQILMPLFLGMPAFASLTMPEMRMVAMGSLVGHLVYGAILGLVFAGLRQSAGAPAPATAR